MALKKSLQLYDTLTKKLLPLEGRSNSSELLMYTCGPTVYAPAHVGNLRTFVVSDWVNRSLEFLGYKVKAALNITDVDDKTIKASRESGVVLADLAHRYEERFFEDLLRLNVRRPELIAHATEYVPAIISMITDLIKKEIAYRAEDGIYFRINHSPNYGVLTGGKLDTSLSQSRVVGDQYDKESSGDFALWKFWKEADGPIGWDAPFGRGRPGWHIECSAMIRETLGPTIDLHLGGSDLIFPHHTNEIAQSEAVNNQPLAKHWMHVAFIDFAGSKMAKSEGNVVNLDDFASRGFDPIVYRYWLLGGHYRTMMTFSWEALEAAATAYRRLANQIINLQSEVGESGSGKVILEYHERLVEAVIDDLNLPIALMLVWNLIKNRTSYSPADCLATILEFDKVLGLRLDSIDIQPEIEVPEKIASLVAERETARQAGNWSVADEFRLKIETEGYAVEDTPTGPKVKKLI